MMNRHPSDQLKAYVDGELTLEEATEVAAHLAECAHCREVISDLRVIQTLLRSLPEPSPNPSLLQRTRARLEPPHVRNPVLSRWLFVGTVVATFTAFLFFLLFSLPPRAHEHGAIWHFRRQAEIASTHPMGDVTLASYLSSPLPYEPFEGTIPPTEAQ